MRPPSAQPTSERIDALLARSAARSDFPAKTRIIHDLHTAVRREKVAALDVVRLILKDPGLSSKVLRVVNSAFYRPRSDPISTITRAVIVLGFETIRDVATGLVVIEALLRGGRPSEYIREGLKRALHRGLLAQELSGKVGYPVPEEAYLLGLFADWGMLWTAAYFPDEFDKATVLQREAGGRLEDAVCQVLGVPPAELAATILQRWDFPATYAEYFRLPHATTLAGRSLGDKLLAVVGVAAEATTPPCAEDAVPPGTRALERFQALFHVAAEPFLEASQSARVTLRQQAPLYGLGPVHDAGEDDTAAPAAAPGAAGPEAAAEAGGVPAVAATAVEQPGQAQAALAIIGEITRAMVEQLDLNDILAMVLEGVARAGSFDVVFLALLNQQRDHLVGRLGYGENVKEALRELRVPMRAHAGVLPDAVLNVRPHVVPSGSPAPQLSQVRSFVVHPLVVRGKAVGALVAGRTEGAETTPDDLVMVNLFCGQAALALDRSVR